MVKSSDHKPPATPEQSSAPSQEYAESGVDRSLIRWMLSLSPDERLLAVQQQVNAVQQIQGQLNSD